MAVSVQTNVVGMHPDGSLSFRGVRMPENVAHIRTSWRIDTCEVVFQWVNKGSDTIHEHAIPDRMDSEDGLALLAAIRLSC